MLIVPTGSDIDGLYFESRSSFASGIRLAGLIISWPPDGSTRAVIKCHKLFELFILMILPAGFGAASVLLLSDDGVGSVAAWAMVGSMVFLLPLGLLVYCFLRAFRDIRQLLEYWSLATVT